MDYQKDDIDVEVAKDIARIEGALKAFWEKAHSASDLITRDRTEIKSLREQLTKLEKDVQLLRLELQTKNQEVKRLQAEHAQLVSSSNDNVFTREEKENLQNRIGDLLVKINSHL